MKPLFKNSVIVILLFGTAIYLPYCKKEAIPPVVKTSTVSVIFQTSALTGGTVTDDGNAVVTEYGICWSISPNPTISTNKKNVGTGIGSFTISLNGLNANTKYYVRAYAISSVGISYGNEITFLTMPEPITMPEPEIGQKADFPGGPRFGLKGFSIGTKLYLGLGYDYDTNPVNDFWEWDQASNMWTRKADFPGNAQDGAVCFSIGTRGYIGTGAYYNYPGTTNEFWEYNPETNSWTQKASLPTTPSRGSATGFSIGSKGYIGTGWKSGTQGSYYSDFWEWDQDTNVWTRKADFPGNARSAAVGFSIGSKGYIGTGCNDWGNQDSYYRDFWEWNQATNVWTKKADFPGIGRVAAVGFSIGSKGYIGTGNNNGQDPYFYQDFWEWDQITNTWTKSADFLGGPRTEAVGVSFGTKGYIGTGIGYDPNILQDFWEYIP